MSFLFRRRSTNDKGHGALSDTDSKLLSMKRTRDQLKKSIYKKQRALSTETNGSKKIILQNSLTKEQKNLENLSSLIHRIEHNGSNGISIPESKTILSSDNDSDDVYNAQETSNRIHRSASSPIYNKCKPNNESFLEEKAEPNTHHGLENTSDLMTHNRTLQCKLEEALKDKEQWIKKYTVLANESNQKQLEVQQSLNALSELKYENIELKQEINETKQIIDENNSVMQQLMQTLDENDVVITQKQTTINGLQNQVNILNQSLKEETMKVDGAIDDNNAMNEELLREKEKTIDRLQREIETMNAEKELQPQVPYHVKPPQLENTVYLYRVQDMNSPMRKTKTIIITDPLQSVTEYEVDEIKYQQQYEMDSTSDAADDDPFNYGQNNPFYSREDDELFKAKDKTIERLEQEIRSLEAVNRRLVEDKENVSAEYNALGEQLTKMLEEHDVSDLIQRLNNFVDVVKFENIMNEKEEIIAILKKKLRQYEPYECPICFVEYNFQDDVFLMDCDHLMNRECALQTFKADIMHNRILPRCPQCLVEKITTMVTPRQLECVMDEQTMALYQQLSINVALQRLNLNLFQCPTADCQFFAEIPNDLERFNCNNCGYSYCTSCKRAYHHNETCDEYKQRKCKEELLSEHQLVQLAEEKGWKQCPKCTTYIERAIGCFHMKCGNAQCKAEYCDRCGMELDSTNWRVHFNPPSECHLWNNEEDLLNDDHKEDI